MLKNNECMMKILFCVCLIAGFNCKHDSQKMSANSNNSSFEIHFLIYTDPIAYSFHKDCFSSSEYCNGLKYCIHRIYDVIRLSEVKTNCKFSIAQTGLQFLIKCFEVPKLNESWFAYVLNTVIDKLLN